MQEILPARQDQIDHVRQVLFKLHLVLRVAPGSVPSQLLAFAEYTKVAGARHQDVVYKHRWVTFNAESFGQS